MLSAEYDSISKRELICGNCHRRFRRSAAAGNGKKIVIDSRNSLLSVVFVLGGDLLHAFLFFSVWFISNS